MTGKFGEKRKEREKESVREGKGREIPIQERDRCSGATEKGRDSRERGDGQTG